VVDGSSPSEEQLATMDAKSIEARLHDLSREALETLIRRANREYWDENRPSLPDTLYDRMVERLRALAPDAELLGDLGPAPSERPTLMPEEIEDLPPEARFGHTVQHRQPMLSLDKCYADADLLEWAGKFEGDILAMPKLDGIALSIRYGSDGGLKVAATRGSGTEGEDVTANVLEIDDIPRQLPRGSGALEVRGELFMRLGIFARYRDQFANPRNLTAGAIKHKDRAKSRAYDLSFFAYDLLGTDAPDEQAKMARLEEIGIPTADHRFVDRAGLAAVFEEFVRLRPTLDYEIDGVVYRAASVREQIRLGATAHHPRSAIAYKFQGDTGETRLLDVQWSVSRTGTITPTAVLDPIELSGAMISKAGLHNLSRFRDLGITKGALLEVTRRGGVIPHVERVVANAPDAVQFEIPTRCPACGGETTVRRKREGEFLQCARPEQCITSRLRELEHFASVVDIQGFGPKIIGQIVDAGLLSAPADFYRLDPADLEPLDRLGRKSAQNLVEQVDSHRTVPLATFLEALGIEHLGTQNARVLAREFRSLAAVRALAIDQLMALKGFKESIAGAIVEGLKQRAHVIEDLLSAGVQVPDAPEETPTDEATLPLLGKSFVFTGTLEAFDRKTAQGRVRALGGDAPDGVTKTLSYLVVGSGRSKPSSKLKKAEKLRSQGASVEIITEGAFVAMLAEHGGIDG
jgi:DNA ligase (NAD+)